MAKRKTTPPELQSLYLDLIDQGWKSADAMAEACSKLEIEARSSWLRNPASFTHLWRKQLKREAGPGARTRGKGPNNSNNNRVAQLMAGSPEVTATLQKREGKWALVSPTNPDSVKSGDRVSFFNMPGPPAGFVIVDVTRSQGSFLHITPRFETQSAPRRIHKSEIKAHYIFRPDQKDEQATKT